ncbi:hypothetical protein LguiA_001438 [Lonicera macranthoides]
MAPALKPFQLLEINIISAQDLEPVSRKMKTYATAWVHPNRKLTSRVDSEGHNNPTWNDKFVFRVDEEFLQLDTSAVMIEIYARSWFRDTLVGTVRVLVGNLFPPHTRPQPHHHNLHLGMRFVALQVRRNSGRPQGLLNIGVALLDSSMRSMPLYNTIAASAVGYQDLMGGEEDPQINQHQNENKNTQLPAVKPILRRSRSERSERITFDNMSSVGPGSMVGGSMVGVPQKKAPGKASSMISGSDFGEPLIRGKGIKGKPSSVIGGVELRDPKIKGKRGKASSLVSDSVVSRDMHNKDNPKNGRPTTISKNGGSEVSEKVGEKTATKSSLGLPPKAAMGNGKLIFAPPPKPNSIWSDSEVGPSPSEVAAAMVERRYPLEEERSSVLDGWSLDESVEGLRSKLERWRTELPPLYDRGFSSSFRSSTNSQHTRRHADGSTGLFSCFGNFYGYECQCICGKPRARKNTRFQSSSIGSRGGSTFL